MSVHAFDVQGLIGVGPGATFDSFNIVLNGKKTTKTIITPNVKINTTALLFPAASNYGFGFGVEGYSIFGDTAGFGGKISIGPSARFLFEDAPIGVLPSLFVNYEKSVDAHASSNMINVGFETSVIISTKINGRGLSTMVTIGYAPINKAIASYGNYVFKPDLSNYGRMTLGAYIGSGNSVFSEKR